MSEGQIGQHSIPVDSRNVPIWQPPQRLCPKKDRYVEEQVQNLVSQGMVEPGGGTWNFGSDSGLEEGPELEAVHRPWQSECSNEMCC